MNRNESREKERRTKKLQSWLRNLNADQRILWEQTILSKIEKNDRTTAEIIDTCFMAAMANNSNLELIDIERIVLDSSVYIQDYKGKLENYKGDMISMIKSTETKIQSTMRALIKAKKDKIESIKKLEVEYNIPLAELDVMWLQVKSKMGIVNKHAPKPKNVAEEEMKEVIEETKEIPYKEIEKERTITIEEAATVNPNKPKLKIINRTIEVEGKYGTYEKSSNGVTTSQKTYKDITEVEEEKKAYFRRMENKEKEIKDTIEKLSKELHGRVNKKLEDAERYAEIEEVFNI